MNNWSQAGIEKQTKLTLACFPSLTQEQTDRVLFEWAQSVYEDSPSGHDRAQADLMNLCRWESMSETQRVQEKKRVREG